MGAKLGWGELVVILIIALVVLGPEKLPQMGRALGKAVKGVKKYVREVTDELDAGEEVRELRKDLEEIRRDVSSMGKDIEKSVSDVSEDLTRVKDDMQAAGRELDEAVEDEPKQKAPAPDEETPENERASEGEVDTSPEPARDEETVTKEDV